MKVVKFGGTSLANAEQVKKVCDIVLSDKDRRLVVVSAPGKRSKEDTKVTDMLINCAEKFLSTGNADAEVNAIVDRYREIAFGLGLSEEIAQVIEKDLKGRLPVAAKGHDRFLDCMKAAGEDNSAKVVAAYLKSLGYNAKYVNPKDAGMILSDECGNARVLKESYEKLNSLKNEEGIMIFPGFFGYSKEGNVVTFPRGGSDITGAILAAAIKADVYENFTDVDSVYSANPNWIKDPKAINVITYREMRELSYAGFSVLHEESLEPVYHKGVPVNIRNTNNPTAPGTLIAPERERGEDPVIGIACKGGFCSIYVSKYMMNREVGFGRKLLNILEDDQISYEHTPSGIDNISIILSESEFPEEKRERVLSRIKNELDADSVSLECGIALVMVVGEGMLHTIGVTGRAAKALADASVNIVMINQGSSEVSIMFGVSQEDEKRAVKCLYDEFFPKG